MRRFLLVLVLLGGCPLGGSGVDNPATPGSGDDPLTRTDEELCARWKRDRVEVKDEWSGDQSSVACDLGTVNPAAQDNGVRRTNLYRWLVGLPPVIHEPLSDENQQNCALMMAANGTIDHYPPSSWRCYTSMGAQGAGSSNLALGTGMSLSDTVDGYVQDDGANNYQEVGHRRWLLDPAMRSTSFGYELRGPVAYSCMHVADALPAADVPAVDFVAYPPPGPVPVAAAAALRLTFSSNRYLATPQTAVEISRNGGAPAQPAITLGNPGIGRVRTSIIVDGPGAGVAGDTMKVTITGLTRDGKPDYASWTTRWVDCGR